MSPSDLVLYRNIALSDVDSGGQTSTVGEPSAANNGRQIFMTGNWYASRSLDSGATWTFVSPFSFLPPVDNGFCCDQTVLYDHSRDLTFWLLQYITLPAGNTLRVAVKRGATLAANDWYWYDFRPSTVNPAWTNEWFDYNHAALSNNFLYVVSNVFPTTGGAFRRCVALRLPLDALRAATGFSYQYFNTTRNGSLRCTLGARDTMYFGSHNNLGQIRVFSWPESANALTFKNVNVAPWQNGPYTAAGPDGNNWMSRTDGRITAGWVGNGRIGFAWSASAAPPARPFPHVRVVRLDEATQTLIDQPDIWNQSFAYAYPDICPNDRGHLGIALFRGGGGRHPGHVVGVWDDYAAGWTLQAAVDGTNGPADGKWGDYLTCRRHSPDGLTWMATGYSLQGGSRRTDIEPRIVHFGRRRDEPAAERWRDA